MFTRKEKKIALQELEIKVEQKYIQGKTINYSEIRRYVETNDEADKICGRITKILGITIRY